MGDFGSFYLRHRKELFHYLLRMTGDHSLSEDLLQESFTRFLDRYGKADPTLPLLYTIARNALFDHWKKKKPVLSGDGAERAGGESPEDGFLAREEARALLLALRTLPEDERDLLSLAVTRDLSYREISGISGLSEGNIKVKIHRARRKLRDMLKEK